MNTLLFDILTEDYRQVVALQYQALDRLKNNTLVITGGTGFVGTWISGLVAYLNDTYAFNTQIILIARNTEEFKLTRPHLAKRRDVRIIPADVRYLHELPSETNWLIHAAGTPDNRFHASYPIETMSVIAQGTHSVLRAVERCSNFKMLLNISSGLIYGNQPESMPNMDEDYAGPLKCATASSAYAEAKRFGETLCQSSRSQSHTPIVTARPFAFMGPFQSIDTPWALNNFIKDALAGNKIRVLGDGKTVRSYMYASDMAFWLLTILTSGTSGEVYNVGSAESIALADLAQLVAENCNPSLKIQLGTSSSTVQQNSRFVPDISLAQERLQLNITVNLTTAIQKTISWHNNVES